MMIYHTNLSRLEGKQKRLLNNEHDLFNYKTKVCIRNRDYETIIIPYSGSKSLEWSSYQTEGF